MDAVAHFTQLARYNVWATARVLDAVRALPEEAYRRDVGPVSYTHLTLPTTPYV